MLWQTPVETKIIDFKKLHRKRRYAFFNQKELNTLFSVYGRQVAAGHWGDYEIDQRHGLVAFSIFKRAEKKPIFTVAKLFRNRAGKGKYLLLKGTHRLYQTDSLDDVLAQLPMDEGLFIQAQH